MRPPLYQNKEWLDCAQELNRGLNQLLERRPEVTCIFMPESAYPFCLNEYASAVELLTDVDGNNDVTILMGAYKNNEQGMYNSVYILSHNSIRGSYDKTERVPFVEYIPMPWRSIPAIENIFFKQYKEFSPQKGDQGFFTLFDTPCIPYICSDLFLQAPLHRQHEDAALLCCVNDSWFADGYIPHMMYLFAKYYAMAHVRDCWYISHTRGMCISKYGDECVLLE